MEGASSSKTEIPFGVPAPVSHQKFRYSRALLDPSGKCPKESWLMRYIPLASHQIDSRKFSQCLFENEDFSALECETFFGKMEQFFRQYRLILESKTSTESGQIFQEILPLFLDIAPQMQKRIQCMPSLKNMMRWAHDRVTDSSSSILLLVPLDYGGLSRFFCFLEAVNSTCLVVESCSFLFRQLLEPPSDLGPSFQNLDKFLGVLDNCFHKCFKLTTPGFLETVALKTNNGTGLVDSVLIVRKYKVADGPDEEVLEFSQTQIQVTLKEFGIEKRHHCLLEGVLSKDIEQIVDHVPLSRELCDLFAQDRPEMRNETIDEWKKGKRGQQAMVSRGILILEDALNSLLQSRSHYFSGPTLLSLFLCYGFLGRPLKTFFQ